MATYAVFFEYYLIVRNPSTDKYIKPLETSMLVLFRTSNGVIII